MQSWVESLSMQSPSTDNLWRFLPFGYLLTVIIESPFLWAFLPKLTFVQRFLCGLWLTACTYPIVVLVLPTLMQEYSRGAYLLVAEIFAPVAECVVFWFAFRGRKDFKARDWQISFVTITIANLASFAAGEILWLIGY